MYTVTEDEELREVETIEKIVVFVIDGGDMYIPCEEFDKTVHKVFDDINSMCCWLKEQKFDLNRFSIVIKNVEVIE